MLRIDAHQHFWEFNPGRDTWITGDMKVIQQDFMPTDLEALLVTNGLDGCVAVQSDQSEEHNQFLLSLAGKYDFIKGVVGWVDLQSEQVKDRLDYYSQFEKCKGFRHVLQAEQDEAFMLRKDFLRGIAALQPYGFTYDILIFPNHISYAAQLVSSFPDQRFVIDHVAKPYIKDKRIDEWKRDITAIAGNENVWCKISGMVTEADWKFWTLDDLRPYLDIVMEAFGPGRLMFGSDWPVCLLAATYNQWVDAFNQYASEFSAGEQSALWGGNAAHFYQLT
ncbi:MAG: amidohydrolase family protein [Chitinophagaceae bacterium]